MPTGHRIDYKAQEEVLIIFWKSRRLPTILIQKLIEYHCGTVYRPGTIDRRAATIRQEQQDLGYLRMTDSHGHLCWDAADRWIRRQWLAFRIDTEEIERLISLSEPVRAMLRLVSAQRFVVFFGKGLTILYTASVWHI